MGTRRCAAFVRTALVVRPNSRAMSTSGSREASATSWRTSASVQRRPRTRLASMAEGGRRGERATAQPLKDSTVELARAVLLARALGWYGLVMVAGGGAVVRTGPPHNEPELERQDGDRTDRGFGLSTSAPNAARCTRPAGPASNRNSVTALAIGPWPPGALSVCLHS